MFTFFSDLKKKISFAKKPKLYGKKIGKIDYFNRILEQKLQLYANFQKKF